MIGVPATLRIFVAVAPTDLRLGYDGLARLAREVLEQDPLSGHLFVFSNRRRNRTTCRACSGLADRVCVWRATKTACSSPANTRSVRMNV